MDPRILTFAIVLATVSASMAAATSSPVGMWNVSLGGASGTGKGPLAA